MTVTIFCEGSMSPHSGIAAWGAAVKRGADRAVLSGPLPTQTARGLTLCELHAVQKAIETATAKRLAENEDVIIAMRSMAAIAVLRWLFPDAPYEGPAQKPPKDLRKGAKQFGPLEWIENDVKDYGLRIVIRYVTGNADSGAAKVAAREQRQVLEP